MSGARDPFLDSVIAGRYRVLEKLGEGAVGAVYLAEHIRIGRRDAIKILREDMSQDREAVARFRRGARNVSLINHPNVCAIYDSSETESGLPFLAMEYVAGCTLSDLLDREGVLPIERATQMLQQVANALDAAHAAGIVHRDLKPANIMLTRSRDGADLVKVVDFDIAKGREDTESHEVTQLGFSVGTPEYMSPEQLNCQELDGRSDIYSMALVFVRMITGQLPFPGHSWREVAFKRLTHAPLPLAELGPGYVFPQSLQDALDRALQQDPTQRQPTASAFVFEVMEAVVEFVSNRAAFGARPLRLTSDDVPSTARLPQMPTTRRSSSSSALPAAPAGSGRVPWVPGRKALKWAAIGLLPVGLIAIVAIVVPDRAGDLMPGTPAALLGPDTTTGQIVDDAAAGSAGPDTANAEGEREDVERRDGGQSVGPAAATQPPAVAPLPENERSQAESGPPVSPPVPDVDALQQRLNQLTLRVNADLPASALDSVFLTAESIWNEPRLPDPLLVHAASIAGIARSKLGDSAGCARWLDRALAISPGNNALRTIRNGCGFSSD
jgi:serine/threonine protein kinase